MEQLVNKSNYLGVFWDIENCNIPRGKSAMEVCEKIRSLPFFHGYTEIQFAVACDATKENPGILNDLGRAQVDIFHVNSNSKNAADKKLKVLMRRFVNLHPHSKIVLISGDGDFTDDIFDIKTHKSVEILLIYPHKTADALKTFAHSSMSYNTLVADINADIETQLKITNLPSLVEDERLNVNSQNFLSWKVNNYSGRIISYDGESGSAILTFCNTEDARRFKDVFSNHRIGARNIFVQNHRSRSIPARPRDRSRTVSRNENRIRRFSSQENVNNFSGRNTPGWIENSVSDQRIQASSENVRGTPSLLDEPVPPPQPSLSNRMKERINRRLHIRYRQQSEATEEFKSRTELSYQVQMKPSAESETRFLELVYRKVGEYSVETLYGEYETTFKIKLATHDQAVKIKEELEKKENFYTDSDLYNCKHECYNFTDEKLVRVVLIIKSLKTEISVVRIQKSYLKKYDERITVDELMSLLSRYRSRRKIGESTVEPSRDYHNPENLFETLKLEAIQSKEGFIRLDEYSVFLRKKTCNDPDVFILTQYHETRLVAYKGRFAQRSLFYAQRLYALLIVSGMEDKLDAQRVGLKVNMFENYLMTTSAHFSQECVLLKHICDMPDSHFMLSGEYIQASPTLITSITALQHLKHMRISLTTLSAFESEYVLKHFTKMRNLFFFINNRTEFLTFDIECGMEGLEIIFSDLFDLQGEDTGLNEKVLENLEKELFSVKYQSSRNSFSPAPGSSASCSPAPGSLSAPGILQPSILQFPVRQPSFLQPSVLQPSIIRPSFYQQPSSLQPCIPKPQLFNFYCGTIHQPPDILGGLVELPNHGASSNSASDLQNSSDNPAVSGISLNTRYLGVVPLARLTGEGVDLSEHQYVQVGKDDNEEKEDKDIIEEQEEEKEKEEFALSQPFQFDSDSSVSDTDTGINISSSTSRNIITIPQDPQTNNSWKSAQTYISDCAERHTPENVQRRVHNYGQIGTPAPAQRRTQEDAQRRTPDFQTGAQEENFPPLRSRQYAEMKAGEEGFAATELQLLSAEKEARRLAEANKKECARSGLNALPRNWIQGWDRTPGVDSTSRDNPKPGANSSSPGTKPENRVIRNLDFHLLSPISTGRPGGGNPVLSGGPGEGNLSSVLEISESGTPGKEKKKRRKNRNRIAANFSVTFQ